MDKRIGAQFYTINKHIKTVEDFDSSCKAVAEMGYKIVQISGRPIETKPMKEILDKYNLKVVTTHSSYDNFTQNLDEVIEHNKALGCDVCGIGSMPIAWSTDTAKVTEFIENMNKVCETLKKENMYFGYHNHAFEFHKNDGKYVYDRLIEETDPETFNFIYDTYWIQAGGKDPVKMLERLGKRAMIVHFKDYKVIGGTWSEFDMCEVGAGNLDWDGIIDTCEKVGTRYALVELDHSWVDDDPFKSLKQSYDFLKTKGFN